MLIATAEGVLRDASYVYTRMTTQINKDSRTSFKANYSYSGENGTTEIPFQLTLFEYNARIRMHTHTHETLTATSGGRTQVEQLHDGILLPRLPCTSGLPDMPSTNVTINMFCKTRTYKEKRLRENRQRHDIEYTGAKGQECVNIFSICVGEPPVFTSAAPNICSFGSSLASQILEIGTVKDIS